MGVRWEKNEALSARIMAKRAGNFFTREAVSIKNFGRPDSLARTRYLSTGKSHHQTIFVIKTPARRIGIRLRKPGKIRKTK